MEDGRDRWRIHRALLGFSKLGVSLVAAEQDTERHRAHRWIASFQQPRDGIVLEQLPPGQLRPSDGKLGNDERRTPESARSEHEVGADRDGEPYPPRRAFPLGSTPSLRAVLSDVRYPRRTPRSMRVWVVVATPSPSNGALRRPRGRRASSTMVTRSLATRCPTLLAKRLRPLRTLSAEKSGPIARRRSIAIHGSRTTGSFCVLSALAPSFSTARRAACSPTRLGSRSANR